MWKEQTFIDHSPYVNPMQIFIGDENDYEVYKSFIYWTRQMGNH